MRRHCAARRPAQRAGRHLIPPNQVRARSRERARREADALDRGAAPGDIRLRQMRELAGLAAPAGPAHVAIVGLGPSAQAWPDIAKRLGGRRAFCDEVWAINSLGDVLACDRIFHMDDVRIQEIRAAAKPDGNIARMLDWMRRHPGPIYTSRAHPDYPGLVEYPLAEVLTSCGGVAYLNNTAAAAVAFAIHLGVRQITCFGMDYTYADAHDAEKGRACTEYYLGIARARGIEIGLPGATSLMDSCVDAPGRLYGYDTVDLDISADADGRLAIAMTPRASLPSADEIEKKYDHSRHPNPLVKE